MAGSIDWKRIPKSAKVVDHGTYYTYGDKLVTWGSLDSLQAPQHLARMIKRKR